MHHGCCMIVVFTCVVNSNTTQHYVIKFVSDLRQVCGYMIVVFTTTMQSVSITTSVVNSNTTQHYVIKFVTHGTAAHASAVHADDL